ncbi:MAG: penicillin-binding protein 2 [Candidatus Omnitrophica bacterium]|nr:penicillin-binding protein 2 [Candidatus Omnitrophota bacterium]
MHISNYRQKVEAVFFVFLLLLLLCVARLFFIQFFNSSFLADIAKRQQNLYVELEPTRGTIYDINFKPLAINIAVDSLYASPNDMKDKDKELIINRVAPILGVDPSYLRGRLSRKKSFVWLARKIKPEQSEALKRMNLKGLGFLKESKRSYPNSYLASHLIGFAGLDNNGLEGAELNYEKYLKGEPGWAYYLRDARQKKLDLWERMSVPKDGFDVILTIDEVIQYIAERELDKAYTTYRAKGATIIVMDPHTGAILALANRPTYDLSNRTGVSKDAIRNRAICDMFEPGSVFKIVTASAAIEEKKASEEDKFFCENGAFRVGPHTLHDHQKHGTLTFREVFEQSSNIGTTKVAMLLGKDTVSKYVKLFGFGSKLGIDLRGEVSGVAKDPWQWSKISIASIPIGQEVCVTALQLASAISVIANGGQLMKPYVVKEIRDKYGEPIKEYSPKMIRKVLSLDTALRIKSILAGVVEEGTGRMGKVPGFKAAGKTGTAQKLEPNGTYSHSKFIASFIGFAPVDDPLITIVVCVDEPRGSIFGGVVSAPVFKNVASDVLRYLKANQFSKDTLALNENKSSY